LTSQLLLFQNLKFLEMAQIFIPQNAGFGQVAQTGEAETTDLSYNI
jgi:hypothetical protein